MKVFCVIVCYNPDLRHLRETCDRLLSDGATVVLVDNSVPSLVREAKAFSDCLLITNDSNLGIARAQNLGIQKAIAGGAATVVFFDQDSRIGQGFLSHLLAPLPQGVPGIVAPVYHDAEQGFEYPSQRLSALGTLRPVHLRNRLSPYEVDVVISSGTAATVETFAVAGVMDEDFFIDYVDTEWCLRCRRAGVPIRIIPAATMTHSVGSQSINLIVARLLVHSPARCYYQIRNCFWLFRKDSVPRLLAIREAAGMAIHKVLLLLVVRNRVAYLASYFAALRDGLRAVTGRQPSRT